MMRFIENNQIPRRGFQNFLDAAFSFQGINRGDQAVMFGKSVAMPVGDITLNSEYLKIQMKHIVEFMPPVVHQSGRHNHHSTFHFTAGGQFP